ncbi:MAG: SapC family protein [Burkholderiales bacterium]|nr:SapC family protein [Burkholderiales bacterium]
MFQQVKPLHPEHHAGLKLKQLPSFDFCAKVHAVPIVGPEFREAAHEFVIAFARSSEGVYNAMAALGLRQEENLFVDANGAWDGRYAPFFIRRYPFLTAEVGDGDAIVCIDEAALPHLQGDDGIAMFQNGEPTEDTRKLAETLFRMRNDANRDQEWIKMLADADLFKPVSASADLPSGEKVSMDGMWVVDEEKLRELPAEKLGEWARSGILPLVYAHLLSLGNLSNLAHRLEKRTAN